MSSACSLSSSIVFGAPTDQIVGFCRGSLTYRKLNVRANQLAHRLIALGVGPEILVGICVERSPEMLIALLATLKAGGAYVPLDPNYPRERLAFMLEDAQVRILITRRRFEDRLPQKGAVCIYPDHLPRAAESYSGTDPAPRAKPNNLAYVIYTSGSTGRPKGVMIIHQGLTNYLTWCTKAYAIEQGNGSLVHSSLCFDLTVTGLFAPLLVGRTVLSCRKSMASMRWRLPCARRLI